MIFENNEIVVVPFPFSDKSASKRRPAVILPNRDFNDSADHVIGASLIVRKIGKLSSADARLLATRIASVI